LVPFLYYEQFYFYYYYYIYYIDICTNIFRPIQLRFTHFLCVIIGKYITHITLQYVIVQHYVLCILSHPLKYAFRFFFFLILVTLGFQLGTCACWAGFLPLEQFPKPFNYLSDRVSCLFAWTILDWIPPNLHFPNSWNYRCESLCLVSTCLKWTMEVCDQNLTSGYTHGEFVLPVFNVYTLHFVFSQ
jgi:hypothetical protein